QAFYCAEAEAARVYNLYAPSNPKNPGGDVTGTLGPQTFSASVALASGTFAVASSAAIDAATQVVTVTATCTLPNGRTRTVQRGGKREFLNPGYNYGVARGGVDPATREPRLIGDLFLGRRRAVPGHPGGDLAARGG